MQTFSFKPNKYLHIYFKELFFKFFSTLHQPSTSQSSIYDVSPWLNGVMFLCCLPIHSFISLSFLYYSQFFLQRQHTFFIFCYSCCQFKILTSSNEIYLFKLIRIRNFWQWERAMCGTTKRQMNIYHSLLLLYLQYNVNTSDTLL